MKSAQENAIAFIDSSVPDWQTLAAGVAPGTEVFILDGTRDGVAQISEVLETHQNVAAVHIISHGSPGSVQLGNITLNSGNLDTYTNLLQQWRSALTENADILIYGCNVADLSPNPLFATERGLSEPPSASEPPSPLAESRVVSYKERKMIMLLSDQKSTTKKYESDRAVATSYGLSAHSGTKT